MNVRATIARLLWRIARRLDPPKPVIDQSGYVWTRMTKAEAIAFSNAVSTGIGMAKRLPSSASGL